MKKYLGEAMSAAQVSTASVGRFDKMIRGEASRDKGKRKQYETATQQGASSKVRRSHATRHSRVRGYAPPHRSSSWLRRTRRARSKSSSECSPTTRLARPSTRRKRSSRPTYPPRRTTAKRRWRARPRAKLPSRRLVKLALSNRRANRWASRRRSEPAVSTVVVNHSLALWAKTGPDPPSPEIAALSRAARFRSTMFLLFYAMNLFYLSYLFIVVAGTDSSYICGRLQPSSARLATGRRNSEALRNRKQAASARLARLAARPLGHLLGEPV